MYLVDTSVWIHGLRPEGSGAIRSRLRPLIVAGETAIIEWIILELMTGLRGNERRASLLRALAPVQRLPEYSTDWRQIWERAWDNAASLRNRGVSPTAADYLIATIAIQYKVPLIHCDSDFETMKRALPLQTVDWSREIR